MDSYSYVVIDKFGKQKKGSIEADSKEKASALLKKQDFIVVELDKAGALNKDLNFDIGGKPKPRDFSVYCRQFESMLNAGVTVIDALNMLSEQTENKVLARATKELKAEVEKGETLSESMKGQKVFPDLLVSMVAAGEASGSLEISFDRMAVQFEKDSKTQALIKKAMIYPIIVGLVAVAVVCVMLTVVIPSYADMFRDMGTELPDITKMVVAMSDFMVANWLIILVCAVFLFFGLKYYAGTSAGQHTFGRLALKLPLIKDLTIKSSSARFARTLSTLLASGLGLVEAVDIVADTMGNVLVKEAMLECKEQIVQGVPLSQPLETCGIFPPMVYHMTKIGEESGNIEGLLEKLANYYEDEVEMATQALTAAMEPMIIIFLAVVVGTLVGAVMAPMLTMYEALDNL